jgi:hypothetical protein
MLRLIVNAAANTPQRFPDPVAKFFAAEVALAIDYLHSLDIIYRSAFFRASRRCKLKPFAAISSPRTSSSRPMGTYA